MKELNIQLNVEQETRIWKKYIEFERNKGKSRFWHYIIGVVLGVTLALLGIGFTNYLLLLTGMFILLGSFLVVAIYFIRFKIYQDKIVAYIQKNIEIQPSFQFWFDDQAIYQRGSSFEGKFNWSVIVRYSENQGDLYLYDSTNQIWNIISEEKIGAENFQRFRALLEREIQSKINAGGDTSN